MLAIVLGRMRERPPRWVGTLLRHHPTTRTWSMIEVMMLGVLVALVKIADYATVIPGVALFVLWVLVFLLAGMQASFDSREVWDRIQWAEAGARRGTRSRRADGRGAVMNPAAAERDAAGSAELRSCAACCRVRRRVSTRGAVRAATRS